MAERAAGRQYASALVTGLVSGGLITLAVSRPWVHATADVAGFATIKVDVAGTDVAPVAGALGFALLAAFGAIVASRGWWRRGLGVLVAIAAIAVVISAIAAGDKDAIETALSDKGWIGGHYDVSTTWWRWLTALGGVGALVAGIATAVYGHRWPTMGARYAAPTAAKAVRSQQVDTDATEAEVWREIDRGHDPTQPL